MANLLPPTAQQFCFLSAGMELTHGTETTRPRTQETPHKKHKEKFMELLRQGLKPLRALCTPACTWACCPGPSLSSDTKYPKLRTRRKRGTKTPRGRRERNASPPGKSLPEIKQERWKGRNSAWGVLALRQGDCFRPDLLSLHVLLACQPAPCHRQRTFLHDILGARPRSLHCFYGASRSRRQLRGSACAGRAAEQEICHLR